MINIENLNKVYEKVIGGGVVLTTKELNSYGFNSKDLNELINNGTLERLKRGFYIFLKIDDLFYYGNTLIANKEYKKAKQCFLKCLEIDAKYPGANFRLFLMEIQDKNYEKAFEYFEQIYDSDNKFYNVDNNVYLYLLSVIIKLPEKYRNYARNLKLEDLIISKDDKRYKDKPEQNRIRRLIYNKKFWLANRQLKDVCNEKGKTSVQALLTKELLNQALAVQKNVMKNIIDLMLQEKYQEVLSYYDEMDTRYDIGIANQYIIMIIKDLLSIIKNNTIPEVLIDSTDKVLDAIKGRNYELALKLNIEYNKTKNIANEKSPLYVALKAINREISKLRESSKSITSVQEEILEVKESPVQIEKVMRPYVENKTQAVVVESNKPTMTNANIEDIVKYLVIQDLDSAVLAVRLYLNSIDKKQYEFLIINLIKLSLLEKDVAFVKPMATLAQISRDNYEFNISEYISEFYMTVSHNNFLEAKINLDILKGAKGIGQDCVFIDALEQLLDKTERQAKQNNSSKKLVNGEDETNTTVTKSFTANPKIIVESKEEIVTRSSTSLDRSKSSQSKTIMKSSCGTESKCLFDKEYIKKQVEKAMNDGVVLLEPMKGSQVEYLLSIINGITGISAFVIGSDSKYQIVLRRLQKERKFIDVKGIIKEGNDFYNNGDYNSCINSYKLLLELENVKGFVFAKIGFAYLKLRNKPLAIEYLTIATGFSKIENSDFDFTDLIVKLQGVISPEDRKPFVRMKTSDFMESDNYYNIPYITDILAMFASGSNINEVCEVFNLNSEQRNIVLLILAREYYYQGDLKTGDIYLKMVEQSQKSGYVISVFNEIRKNRQFYKNRIGNGFTPIMMKLR